MNAWVILGFAGQATFFMRFLVQWIASEKRGESFIPIYFWYLSLSGGLILLVYAIHIGDPVFTLGQSCGILVYIRNLMLIYKKRSFSKAKTPPYCEEITGSQGTNPDAFPNNRL